MRKAQLKKLLLFSLVLACLLALFQAFGGPYVLSNLIWPVWVYFTLMTYVTFTITQSGITKDNKTFFIRVYSSIGIRFVFSLGPLVIYLIVVKQKDVTLLLTYLVLYLFYTGFEAVLTYRSQRKEG